MRSAGGSIRKAFYNISVTSLSVAVALVGLFALAWTLSLAVWKVRRIEERWSGVTPR